MLLQLSFFVCVSLYVSLIQKGSTTHSVGFVILPSYSSAEAQFFPF